MLRMLVKQIQEKGKVSEDIRSGKLNDALNICLSKMNFLCIMSENINLIYKEHFLSFFSA